MPVRITPKVAIDTKRFLAALEQNDPVAANIAGHKEAFRWGRIDPRTQHFQPPWRSADAAIIESQDLMHRRTRNESLNNAQIKGIREAIEDLLVGPGMQTFADPFDPLMDITDLSQETLDPLLQYALEADELYEEWFGDKDQFDVAGKRSGADVQRMLIGECVERGGCLLLRSANDQPGQVVPLAYQIVEYDQLDHSRDRPAGPGQNKIVHGIELDARDREVAFHIYDEHPYDDFTGGTLSGESSRIKANRVIHLCLFRRPSQSVGMSWLHAIGQNNFDRDGFFAAELQKAKKAAQLLLVETRANLKNAGSLGLDDGEDSTDANGNQLLKLGSTPIAFRVGKDDKVELIESAYPTNQADSFIGLIDRDTARGMGLSSFTVTGDYSASNFTSVRGALLAEDSHFRPLQNWFASMVALPIRREFHKQAIALGKLKSVSAADYAKNPRRYNRFDAVGAGRDLLDPEAETNASTGRLRACLTTLKQECARKGQHWIRVLRQIALENRLLDLLDISLDLSKGQGGQTVGNTRSKQDQRDAQEAAQAAKQPAKQSAKGGGK